MSGVRRVREWLWKRLETVRDQTMQYLLCCVKDLEFYSEGTREILKGFKQGSGIIRVVFGKVTKSLWGS